MNIQLINEELIDDLRVKAQSSERLRMYFDLRNTPEDTSQRILNVLEPETQVPIHRHEVSSETIICIKGHIEEIFYEELPNMDAGGPGREFKEILRISLCPDNGQYGCQVPMGVWHTINVIEPSVTLECKDGAYKG